MLHFRMGQWTNEKLDEAKKELDDIFYSTVSDGKGRFDRRSIQKINNCRFDIAELIVRIVEETFLLTNPIPFLVDEQTGVMGEKKVFQELNSALRMVNRAPGAKPISQRLTYKEWDITTSQKEVAVEIPLEKVAVGRIKPSDVATAMAIAINRNRISTVLTALDSAVDAVSDRTGETGFNLRYTGYTAANFDKAINGMLDDGAQPTIFGRYVALAPALQGFAGWSQDITTELQSRGMVAQYRGAAVVSLLDQYNKFTGDHVVPKDRVYLASGTKGAIIEDRDVSFLDYAVVDERTATFAAGRRVEHGVLVWDKYRYRIVTQ
jgi:hypothetical protein